MYRKIFCYGKGKRRRNVEKKKLNKRQREILLLLLSLVIEDFSALIPKECHRDAACLMNFVITYDVTAVLVRVLLRPSYP